jgi:AcrR family transcriptional regulator
MAATASPHDREAIMRAAVRLAARHGSAAVEDILRAAQVNRRIFYRHFASKDALLATLAEDAARTIERDLGAVVEAGADGAAAARAWIERYLALVWEDRAAGAIRPFLAPDPAAGATVVEVVEAGHDRHRALLSAALRRGRADGTLPAVDPDGDAFAVHATVLRHTAICLSGRSGADLPTTCAHVVGVLRRLAGAGS